MQVIHARKRCRQIKVGGSVAVVVWVSVGAVSTDRWLTGLCMTDVCGLSTDGELCVLSG